MGLQLFSIFLEAAVALLFLATASRSRAHRYYYALALTFGIYVWYDLSHYFSWSVAPATTNAAFFIATIAALYAAWRIYITK